MLSKEEIEKAKKFLWDIDDYYTEHATDENVNVIDEDMNEKAEKINNANYYIMQLEQENNKQSKIIDEMAKEMYSNISMLEMAKIGQAIDYDPRKMFAGISDEEAIDCIKQYFEKKVEEK